MTPVRWAVVAGFTVITVATGLLLPRLWRIARRHRPVRLPAVVFTVQVALSAAVSILTLAGAPHQTAWVAGGLALGVALVLLAIRRRSVTAALRKTTADQPSPHAEQLRQAMGWDKLPTMTAEQRAEYERKNAEAQAAARRFYGTTDPPTGG